MGALSPPLSRLLQDDTPTYLPGLDQRKLLHLGALAAKWHEPPRDALDTLVLTCETQDLSALDVYEQIDYMPFDPTVKRTEGTIKDKRDGTTFKVRGRRQWLWRPLSEAGMFAAGWVWARRRMGLGWNRKGFSSVG